MMMGRTMMMITMVMIIIMVMMTRCHIHNKRCQFLHKSSFPKSSWPSFGTPFPTNLFQRLEMQMIGCLTCLCKIGSDIKMQIFLFVLRNVGLLGAELHSDVQSEFGVWCNGVLQCMVFLVHSAQCELIYNVSCIVYSLF